MPAPIPASYVANQVVTEADMNKISDGLRNAAAIQLMTPNQIPYLQSAGQLAGIPAPPGAGTYELVCVNGVFRWQTPAPATPPANSVGSAQIQNGAVGNSELASDAVRVRNIDTTNSPAENEVLTYDNSGRLEYRLARLKFDLIDQDTSGSQSGNLRTYSESGAVGDWGKYAFVFLRCWWVDGSNDRFLQSPMVSFQSLLSSRNNAYAHFTFADPYVTGGSFDDDIRAEGYIRLEKSANRYHFQVQQMIGSDRIEAFYRVELLGIRHRVAGSGF